MRFVWQSRIGWKINFRDDEENLDGVGGKLLESYQEALPDYWRSIHMKTALGENLSSDPDWIGGKAPSFGFLPFVKQEGIMSSTVPIMRIWISPGGFGKLDLIWHTSRKLSLNTFAEIPPLVSSEPGGVGQPWAFMDPLPCLKS